MKDQQVHYGFKVADLIKKSINKTLGPEEDAELTAWLEASAINRQLFEKLNSAEGQTVYYTDLKRFDAQNALRKTKKQFKHISIKSALWMRYAAAVIVLIVVSATLWLSRINRTDSDRNIPGSDIGPGRDMAVLTLANGKKIALNTVSTGELAEQNGISITKAANGTVVYHVSDKARKENTDQYNTIETPRGGTYQISLPDGTKIWLNAASSLHFPVRFSSKERRVVLRGEGYFEVAKDKTKPFFVCTANQQVEVLGTHFNIDAYCDESKEQTTLIEGAVKVTRLGHPENPDGTLLYPGQKSLLMDHNFNVVPANEEQDLAWKKGSFLFDDMELSSILKKLSRWYNIEVDYSNVPKMSYTGFISRNVKLSAVLKNLELTGKVKFRIKNNVLKTIN